MSKNIRALKDGRAKKVIYIDEESVNQAYILTRDCRSTNYVQLLEIQKVHCTNSQSYHSPLIQQSKSWVSIQVLQKEYITSGHLFDTNFTSLAKCGIFNSNLQPLRLTFKCNDDTEYPVIFKTGDDLRQDQLVIQIISLMDKLLLKENLDLKLTPYKVLATGPEHGLMQFVPSSSLAGVLNDHQNNVLMFFREHHPSSEPGNVYGIDPKVMETYTRSCGKSFALTILNIQRILIVLF